MELTHRKNSLYEIIFVDDGGHDGTLKRGAGAGGRAHLAAQVRYLSFSRTTSAKRRRCSPDCGKRPAIIWMLMDADLRHPPTLAQKYRILRDSGGALDLCGAPPRRAGEGKIRACLSRGFYKVWNRLTGMETASGEGTSV